MSTEAEFTRWLQRPEKSFTENLQFALKAWKSAEFTLSSKYELVLKWLAKQGAQLGLVDDTLQRAELTELLHLQCQPGLIASEVKLEFVQMLLQWASSWQTPTSRLPAELLLQLLDFEIVQDLLRFNYELYLKLFAQLLRCYEQYLWAIQDERFLPAHESSFCQQIMSTLSGSAKRAGDLELFRQHYTAELLQPLVQVLLVLQQHDLRFFHELLALEKLLCEDFDETEILERIMQLPMHVRLLTLECAIVNQRGVEKFQKALLIFISKELLEQHCQQDPALLLTIAAHTLEMFRKHDVNLNFEISDKNSALTFLGNMIYRYVEMFKDQHLQFVLQLLCSTLRLNPLILENIFHLTTWMIVAEKRTLHEQELFEEFLKLLIDMFRKLSRAEKFVVNLLKTLNTWLSNYQLAGSVLTAKGKRKLQDDSTELNNTTPQKQRKIAESAKQTLPDGTTRYLDIIFKEFHAAATSAKSTPSICSAQLQSFPQLAAAWPWPSVGVDFSKLIVSLMSKPSLIIWKSLNFSLNEKLQVAVPQQELSENFVFELDFIAALLCQYFAGSKLAEQSDKFWTDIAEQRKLTFEVLAEFGRFLLSRAHNKRTMNAFLECCYYAAHFQLLIWYYRSDRLADTANCQEQAKHIHNFLTEDEWTLLQQRVINFGKTSCKFNFNRLLLQRSQARLLFVSRKKPLNLHKILLAPLGNDLEQLQLLLQAPCSKWLLRSIKREEKLELVRLITNANSFDDAQLQCYSEDLEFFELLCLALYEQLSGSLAAATKKSLLGAIEFEELKVEADAAQDKRVALVADAIKSKIAPYTLKKLPVEKVQLLLSALKQLPLGYCRRQLKGVLFALHLALYRDLKAAQQEEQATLAFEILTDMLHFGQNIQIFKYFSAEDMLQLLPIDAAWEFYEFLFASMKNDEKGAERFLSALVEILKVAQQDEKLDNNHIKLALITIETLSNLNGPSAKRLRKHLDEVLLIYAKHVNAFFAQVEGRSAKKDKRFVEKTLPGFAAYVKSKLGSKQGVEAQSSALDENFRRICKIYIGYSMDYNNMHAIKLITVALNNRHALHFDQDEIEFVLNGYWQQLKADHKPHKLNEKNAEDVIKLVIGNKTNEDLLLTLKEICNQVNPENFTNITHLLTLIAKCPFSTIKGAIFNEQFKLITFEIVLRLQKDEHFQFIDTEQVLNVLACQQAIVENKMVPISSDTLDDMLAFLMDINIKKFPLSDTNVKLFNSLHLSMSELCTALLKHRHLLLLDRVPQFTHIFKDLLQSIVWYKSERQKDTTLKSEELDDLAELALKLEAMMHIIATHSLEVKRVAPFVLTFAINLMVSNKRPTTLYPKIKTHIENICYDLIGICDHRVGRFILRCSNEAARQVYELLVKDHNKYHKFKGKV